MRQILPASPVGDLRTFPDRQGKPEGAPTELPRHRPMPSPSRDVPIAQHNPEASGDSSAVPPATGLVGVAPASVEPADPETRTGVAVPPWSDAEILAAIDEFVGRGWRDHSVTPSPPAEEDDWCARIHHRLLGRAPTQVERNAFVRDRSRDKREKLVGRLLASDEHAWRWAQLLAGALLGGDVAAVAAENRDTLQDYLGQSLAVDKPWDQIGFELLVATGANRPTADDFNGAVNFLLVSGADGGLAAADQTSRVFLGRQLVCSSCHDHPANDWEQRDFWQLAAFFRQMHVTADTDTGVFRLEDRDFAGDSGASKDAEIFYRSPNGRLRIAYPELDGHAVAHSGLLQDVHRREELAGLIVTSEDFRRAAVNRAWCWMLGLGFTQPVDDMGPHNPPSHSELLDQLADQFAAHGHRFDHLLRWIALSKPFGLSGQRTPESWMDAPEKGETPLFARFYETPAPSPDLAKTLMIAANAPTVVEEDSVGLLARRSTAQPIVPQEEIIDDSPRRTLVGPQWLPRLAASSARPEIKIRHVFLALLDREPTKREMTAAKLLVADRMDDAAALSEIWQMLLAEERAAGR